MERKTPGIMNAPWPVELDALTAAPEHHRLIMENEHVRVLETVLPPGERTRVHTHCWPATQYVKSAAHVVRYDGEGQVLFDSRKAGTLLQSDIVRWGEPLPPHSLENVDTVALRVISVEIKK
ncbi:MAG TPA: hypothetical protein VGE21_00095 [Flavobacteriales bacterium]